MNGELAGVNLGGYLPFEFDITGLLNVGENEVVLGVQDATACLEKPINPDSTNKNDLFAPDSIICPIGSAAMLSGLWQPTEVVRRPRTYIDNIWIKTSVRGHTISFRADVLSQEEDPEGFTVSAYVEDGKGAVVKEFGDKPVEITRDGGFASFVESWENPKLWSPENPNLYKLFVMLKKDGVTVNTKIETFGFREFWINGKDFILNGTKINLRACSKHLWRPGQMPSTMKEYAQSVVAEVKGLNANALRLHANPYPEEFLDEADRQGLLIINESASFTFGVEYATSSDLFWNNLKRQWNAHIERDFNHPSFVIASIENELLLTGADRKEGVTEKLVEMGKYVREMSGRPVMFEGDFDPGNSTDIINLHYSHEPLMHNSYPQDAYFLDWEFTSPTPPRGSVLWNRQKPIYMGEFMWIPDPTHVGAVAFGDAFYEDPRAGRMKVKAKFFRMQLQAFREQDIPAFNPWNPLEDKLDKELVVPATVRESYKPVTFFIKEYDTHHYANTNVTRTVTLQNWSETPKEIEFNWTFSDDFESEFVRLNPGNSKVISINLKMPDVRGSAIPYPLVCKMVTGGEVVHETTTILTVYKERLGIANFVLVGGSDVFKKDLERRDFRFDSVSLSEVYQIPNTPVVVAPNTLTDISWVEIARKHESNFVVLLPQPDEAIPFLSMANDNLPTRVQRQDGFTMSSWISDYSSFEADEMMEFFAGDNIIALDAMEMKSGTPMIPILAADTGWKQYYLIADIPGVATFTSVALEQKMSVEPRCALILNGLVSRERTNPNIVLTTTAEHIDSLKILGFDPKLPDEADFSKPIIVYSTSKFSEGIDVTNLHKDSTVIFDRPDFTKLEANGHKIFELEMDESARIKEDGIAYGLFDKPPFSRGMIVESTRFSYDWQTGSSTPIGKDRYKSITSETHFPYELIQGYLVDFRKSKEPNIVVNLLDWDNAWNHPLATLLLSLGVAPRLSRKISMELEKTEGQYVQVEKDSIRFSTVGTATCTFEAQNTKTVTLAFFARQTKAGDEDAKLRIEINGQVKELEIKNTEMRLLTFEFEPSIGDNKITFSFTNDFWEPPDDRNLIIEGIQITSDI